MILRRTVILITFFLAACAPSAPATATLQPASATAAASATVTPTATGTLTPTLSETPTPSNTPTPSITPTYAVLRGKVIVEGRLACRFGPGADYLYKFTFGTGASVEILGRMEFSNWLLVRAVGGANRCWVNGGPKYLQIDGDPLSLAPLDPHIVIAWSYIYIHGLSGVTATRNGDVVTVSWNRIQLNPGDDSGQTPYVVEAWVCQGGQYVFTAVGSYRYSVDIIDEGGCGHLSHARVFAAEKHGYTPFVEVAWPAAGN
jgi:hypothetical protein